MPRSPGRGGHKWRQLQAIVFREETHCWVCGGFVDQTLVNYRSNQARSVDHLDMLCQGGAELSRDNVRLAHIGCNSRLGNLRRFAAARQRTRLVTSRRW